jgi:hypothetical protein
MWFFAWSRVFINHHLFHLWLWDESLFAWWLAAIWNIPIHAFQHWSLSGVQPGNKSFESQGWFEEHLESVYYFNVHSSDRMVRMNRTNNVALVGFWMLRIYLQMQRFWTGDPFHVRCSETCLRCWERFASAMVLNPSRSYAAPGCAPYQIIRCSNVGIYNLSLLRLPCSGDLHVVRSTSPAPACSLDGKPSGGPHLG